MNRMMRILCLLLAVLFLCGAAFAENAGQGRLNGKDNYRVFYEIFVASFSDSDGDGTGDLRGIINRLDYLNDGDPASGRSLGIGGLWLTPVFPSPSYHKYDVTDFCDVDPVFGTLEDLKELVDRCHARDVKVILDLPLNHTGTGHRWFQNFRNAHLVGNAANEHYDFYSWIREGDPVPAGRRFVKLPGTDILYEGNFSDNMPELNFDNEKVRAEVLRVAEFWLELGVDGFRFDAAKYPYLGDHARNTAFWEWYMGELRKTWPDLYAVAEVWDGDGVTERYLKAFNCFHFSTSQAEGLIASTAAGGNVNAFVAATGKYLDSIHAVNPKAMNIPFIANHDTDRAAGYLTMASGRMHMAAGLYLLLPGSPFIYYGEEIGLRGSRGGSNTDANRRLAMLWGDGDTVKDPEGSTYDKQSSFSVKDLEAMDGSLLTHYRKLMRIRKENPEIASGEFRPLSFPDSKAGGFLCTLNGSTVGVFHNTTDRVQVLNLADTEAAFLEEVTAMVTAQPMDGGAELRDGMLTLGPQTTAVLR